MQTTETNSELKAITEAIVKKGYATVNIDNIYYYTVGMSQHNLRDVICLGHVPFSVFQVFVSHYLEEKWVPRDEAYQLEEFTINTVIPEASRFKLAKLPLECSSRVSKFLAKAVREYDPLGFVMLLCPDNRNYVTNEANSAIKYDPVDRLNELIVKIHDQLNEAEENARKILESLGMNMFSPKK